MKPHPLMIALILPAVMVQPVWGHALGVRCKVRGEQVEVETFYDDGTLAGNARVNVIDERKREVAGGRTSARGRWSFELPEGGEYLVLVDAGAGHRARQEFTVDVSVAAARVARYLGLLGTLGGDVACGRVGVPLSFRPPAGSEPELPVSAGPERETFARFPWLNLSLGIGVIVFMSLVMWLVLGWRKPPASMEPRGENENA
jgi:hypothetical protein